jgi:hypothetical protein
MKRWGYLVAAIYAALLVAVITPLWPLASWDSRGFAVYRSWEYWLGVAVLVLAQWLLLLVPVDLSDRRLRPRRHLLVPVVTSAFLLAILAFGAFFSAQCALFGDHVEWPYGALGPGRGGWVAVAIVAALWILWGLAFWRFGRGRDPESLLRKLTSWLLKGSILELLVAIPSHLVTRHRHDCCAPAATFLGIATGLAVMLLSFGPGVLFLFAERIRRKTAARSVLP